MHTQAHAPKLFLYAISIAEPSPKIQQAQKLVFNAQKYLETDQSFTVSNLNVVSKKNLNVLASSNSHIYATENLLLSPQNLSERYACLFSYDYLQNLERISENQLDGNTI